MVRLSSIKEARRKAGICLSPEGSAWLAGPEAHEDGWARASLESATKSLHRSRRDRFNLQRANLGRFHSRDQVWTACEPTSLRQG